MSDKRVGTSATSGIAPHPNCECNTDTTKGRGTLPCTGKRTLGTGGFQTVVTGTAAEFCGAPQRENPDDATSGMKRYCQ